MATARRFRDLDVYRMALKEAHRIFEMTKTFPAEERFGINDQMRRSSRAVAAIVAEGWTRRRYRRMFVNKMNETQAEAAETQAWLDHAKMCGYISAEQYREMDGAWQKIGGKLQRMIQTAENFSTVRGPESK